MTIYFASASIFKIRGIVIINSYQRVANLKERTYSPNIFFYIIRYINYIHQTVTCGALSPYPGSDGYADVGSTQL